MKYKMPFIFSSCFASACGYINKAPDQIPADLSAQQSQSNPSQNHLMDSVTQFPCKTNEDCVLVDKGCCGCGSGGESIAIPISQKDSYNNQLEKRCLELNCVEWARCGEFQAQCQNSQCVTIKK